MKVARLVRQDIALNFIPYREVIYHQALATLELVHPLEQDGGAMIALPYASSLEMAYRSLQAF